MKQLEQALIFFGEGKSLYGDAIAETENRIRRNETTSLCEIMRRHGSDKGLGWHNYTVLYDTLLSLLKPSACSLMEVGLGTNYPEMPYSMGANGVPGASLRGWREYLPSCMVYGADIDRRILFEEERIQTFYADQTDPVTIRSMLAAMPSRAPFDVIVDDGCHQFAANRTTLQGLIMAGRPGGLYIIEDVCTDLPNLLLFHDFMDQSGFSGFIYRIPHATNHMDNAVAVVRIP